VVDVNSLTIEGERPTLFDANLRALHARFPRIAESLLTEPLDPAIEGVETRGGTVIVRLGEGGPVAITPLERPAERARAYWDAHPKIAASAEPVFLAGIQAGHELFDLFARVPARDWEPERAIYVYEESLDLLRANLSARDWRPVLESKRVFLFAGPDAATQCREFFLGDPWKPFPAEVLALGDAAAARHAAAVLGETKTALARLAAGWKTQADAHYDAIAPVDVARRFADLAGARVLIVSNRFSYFMQHSVRDLSQTLARLGARPIVFRERDAVDRFTGPGLLALLATERPDAMVLIDHVRAENASIYPAGLPVLTWVQDHVGPIHDAPEPARMGRFDLLFGYTDGLTRRGFAPEALCRMPMTFNPAIYRPPRRALPHPGFDVAFVSNVSAPHAQAVDEVRAHYAPLGPAFRRVIDWAAEWATSLAPRAVPTWEAFAALAAVRARAEGLDPAAIENPIFILFDRVVGPVIRHAPLEALARAGVRLRLFGRGWEHHPRLAPFAGGVIENGRALRDLCAAVPINLHINPFSAEHQRLIEGTASGGFFLVFRRPRNGVLDLDDVLFDDAGELVAKVEHFLARPEARAEYVRRNRPILDRAYSSDRAARHLFDRLALRAADARDDADRRIDSRFLTARLREAADPADLRARLSLTPETAAVADREAEYGALHRRRDDDWDLPDGAAMLSRVLPLAAADETVPSADADLLLGAAVRLARWRRAATPGEGPSPALDALARVADAIATREGVSDDTVAQAAGLAIELVAADPRAIDVADRLTKAIADQSLTSRIDRECARPLLDACRALRRAGRDPNADLSVRVWRAVSANAAENSRAGAIASARTPAALRRLLADIPDDPREERELWDAAFAIARESERDLRGWIDVLFRLRPESPGLREWLATLGRAAGPTLAAAEALAAIGPDCGSDADWERRFFRVDAVPGALPWDARVAVFVREEALRLGLPAVARQHMALAGPSDPVQRARAAFRCALYGGDLADAASVLAKFLKSRRSAAASAEAEGWAETWLALLEHRASDARRAAPRPVTNRPAAARLAACVRRFPDYLFARFALGLVALERGEIALAVELAETLGPAAGWATMMGRAWVAEALRLGGRTTADDSDIALPVRGIAEGSAAGSLLVAEHVVDPAGRRWTAHGLEGVIRCVDPSGAHAAVRRIRDGFVFWSCDGLAVRGNALFVADRLRGRIVEFGLPTALPTRRNA
jgi:hypothetical protein